MLWSCQDVSMEQLSISFSFQLKVMVMVLLLQLITLNGINFRRHRYSQISYLLFYYIYDMCLPIYCIYECSCEWISLNFVFCLLISSVFISFCSNLNLKIVPAIVRYETVFCQHCISVAQLRRLSISSSLRAYCMMSSGFSSR